MTSPDRPPLRSAPPTTSPPLDGGEEGRLAPDRHSILDGRKADLPDTFPLPPEGGEVAPRSGDGVGEVLPASRSRRQRGTTARARKLRQGGNRAEALLWLELKNRKLGGHRFTRQLPIGRYFADFACRERRLIVEVDGSQHAGSTQDSLRDEFILTQGYSVLRFWNTDVLRNRRSVCDTILAALEDRLGEQIEAFDLRYHQAKQQRSSRRVEPLTLNQRVQQREPNDSTSSNPDTTS